MKTILMVLWMLIIPCSVSFGQTNSAVARSQALANSDSPMAHFDDVQGALRPREIETFSQIERDGLLKSQGQTPGRFSPKIIHLGRVQVYSSVVTAAARKNPLCLLDATFLNISF